jgi:hypothetical protein
MMEVTSVEKPLPRPAAPIWSGNAEIGTRNLEWFYWPRHWLHVREQEPNNPRCWMNIETPEGFREEVLKAIRSAKQSPRQARTRGGAA